MKTPIAFIAILTLMVLQAFSQPQISNLSYPSTVDMYGMYEISFTLGHYSNPYDPDTISVYAVFTGPDNSSFTVNGFYYEGFSFQQINGYEQATANPSTNGWRVRFTPTATGLWSFCIHAIDIHGETTTEIRPLGTAYTFNCLPVRTADGFIYKANSRYLKREVVKNGIKQDHSFFPIGPNIAWYACEPNCGYQHPYGIYDYEKYIDSLDGKCNYMRVFLNRYQHLNLYGPEYTQLVNGLATVYFDSTLNQKDAMELDHIISYAKQHNVTVMLCIFSYPDFTYLSEANYQRPDVWENNPYNTIIESPAQFFIFDEPIRVTKNLIRYIIARWGYATNLLCWELWNEVTNMWHRHNNMEKYILDWHDIIGEFVKDSDPFNHLVSTSVGSLTHYPQLFPKLYWNMDIVQLHNYQNIQKAKSKEQFSKILFDKTILAHENYPDKPFFMGEFGFGQSGPSVYVKDPYGIDLHNSLWSSLFSTSMGPASFWWWNYVSTKGLFNHFKPLLTFCSNLPIPSDSFTPHITGYIENDHVLAFPNNIETYYMKNNNEDTIYGWSQDTAFAYQSLRWLTDNVYFPTDLTDDSTWHFISNSVFDSLGYVYTMALNKRPQPSSNSNTITIPITNQPNNTRYGVKWYDSETGLQIPGTYCEVYVQQNISGDRYIIINFPSSIRDLTNHIINNKYGDAVF